MNSNNIQSNKAETKNALVLIDQYTQAGLSEIEALCNANNLNVSCVIYNYTLHESRPYKDIIKYVTRQKQPMVILVNSNTRLFPQCIMSTAVIGTLEEMQLAEIHIWDKDHTKDTLSISNRPVFDLLKEATYQLKSIERMAIKEEKRERNRGK